MNTRRTSTTRLVSIAAGLLCVTAISLHADTITVTNTNDAGPGSLRQAIIDANDGDTIDFGVTGTIGLTSGELLVNKSINISGPGADSLAVDGNAMSRVLHIGPDHTAVISGLSIINGTVPFGDLDGGGGIYNDHASLTVNSCTVSSNFGLSGGGIFNDGEFGHASLQFNDSILADNSSFRGGGILSDGSGGSVTLQISNSTISGNSSGFGQGGGIYSSAQQAGTAILQIDDSTINGNSSSSLGAGIYNDGHTGNATLELTNSTVSGNSTAFNGGGGGVFNDGSEGNAIAQLANTTLSGNTSQLFGSAIYNYGSSGTAFVEIANTIFNSVASSENITNNSGTITSHGYNLSSDDAGGYLTGPGDQENTDPLLGPLQNNGGATLTHRPFTGSPAIDSGDPTFTPPPLYDQRGPGFDRVVNGRLDIGSYEGQNGKPPPAPTPRPRPTPHQRPTPR